MPFTSKSQEKKCFALKARGQAKGWNCNEWAAKTDQKSLPSVAEQHDKHYGKSHMIKHK